MHSRQPIVAVLFAAALLCLLAVSSSGAAEPAPAKQGEAEPIDYKRHIEPILAGNCYRCHGAGEENSGLRLDDLSAAFAGGYSGPAIVAGDAHKSLLIEAITGEGDMPPMPPEGEGRRLAAREIALLKRWIDEGARGPSGPTTKAPGERRTSDHWSFQPIERAELPPVAQRDWPRNEIDRFILARLEAAGLAPSPEADRVTLIRRLSLDLIGLPPTIAEVEEFLADQSEGAYERLVDRLLASPHYGERWGRHWLDLARYADSNGYTIDNARSIWKYRDWVIDALNRDLPFDQFTIEQLAGDMLPAATVDQQIATGLHRNTLKNEEGGTDPEEFRVEAVVDRVSTTGTVWLGLTIGCARCHDHKFDPISQRDFYQLFAFFNGADEPTLPLPTAKQTAEQNRLKQLLAEAQQPVKAVEAELNIELAELEATYGTSLSAILSDDVFNAEVAAALAVQPAERTKESQQIVASAYYRGDVRWQQVNAEVDRIKAQQAALAKQITTTLVMKERAQPRPTFLHLRGDFLRPGPAMNCDVPEVLPELNAEIEQPNRLDLAQWLVDGRNPLVARVTVNRVWQHYFGKGLVATENDFGTQGELPSHPELLDWLADTFMADGWSLKALHRRVVTSATYRQTSRERPELMAVDADNRLLGRQSRLRLEAEIVRDVSLAAAGLLSHKVGGPSVYPPIPAGAMDGTQQKKAWPVSTGEDRYRRGMYTFLWRSAPHPMLSLFDAPESNTTCTRRDRSTTPLQALALLNDEASYEAAQALAVRVLDEALSTQTSDDTAREQLRYAFRLCLARQPSDRELDILAELLKAELAEPHERLRPTPAIAQRAQELDANELAAWVSVSRALLNLDEFITRE